MDIEEFGLDQVEVGEADDVAELIAQLELLGSEWLAAPGQMEKVRADQVLNTAGGYVFQVSDGSRVRRFLILGTSGGSYYSTEKEMTMDNVGALTKIIQMGKGAMVIKEIVAISTAGRAPRQDPAIFALALCAHFDSKCDESLGQDQALYSKYISSLKDRAMEVLPKVCRIPTHLFKFARYSEMISKQLNNSTGWGRRMRSAIADWYLKMDPEKLAYHVTKYQCREGWSHRDLLRLSHPRPSKVPEKKEELNNIFNYVVKGKRKWIEEGQEAVEPKKSYQLIDNVCLLKEYNEAQRLGVAQLVEEHGLAREVIPSNFLNFPEVWKAMIPKMPLTALIRNLGKISSLGLTESGEDSADDVVSIIVEKLTNQENLHKALIHPVQILFALVTYKSGKGFRGSLQWKKNSQITTALNKAFDLSFKNVKKTGKRICLALDVSGSMTQSIMNSCLTCRDASCAMSAVFLRTEDEVECVGFSEELIDLPFMTKTASIEEMANHMDGIPFGRTDCAQPMLWAARENKKFDAFIVFTDCETYFGDVHPFEAMKQYREKSGIQDAKLIVCGMTATNFTIADPTDAGMLDVVGFDAAVPNIVNDFIAGSL